MLEVLGNRPRAMNEQHRPGLELPGPAPHRPVRKSPPPTRWHLERVGRQPSLLDGVFGRRATAPPPHRVQGAKVGPKGHQGHRSKPRSPMSARG